MVSHARHILRADKNKHNRKSSRETHVLVTTMCSPEAVVYGVWPCPMSDVIKGSRSVHAATRE